MENTSSIRASLDRWVLSPDDWSGQGQGGLPGLGVTTQPCTRYQYHQKYGIYLVSISKKYDYFLIQLN